MKITLFLLAAVALLPCGSPAAADTNELICTFTNTEGRVYENVRITGADALGCFAWTTNGAGSRVPFATAPEWLRDRYKYDAGTAAVAQTQKSESDRAYRLWLARDTARLQTEAATLAAYKARKAAFLASLVEVKGEIVQRSGGMLHVQITHQAAGAEINQYGRVSSWSGSYERVAIKNHPDFESLRTRTQISLWLVPAGDLDYTTVAGDPNRIALYDAAVPAEFAHDPEVLAYMPPGPSGGQKNAWGVAGAVWR